MSGSRRCISPIVPGWGLRPLRSSLSRPRRRRRPSAGSGCGSWRGTSSAVVYRPRRAGGSGDSAWASGSTSDSAPRVVQVTEDDGLGSGQVCSHAMDDFAVAQLSALSASPSILRLLNALHAVRALLHHAAHAHRDVRVELHRGCGKSPYMGVHPDTPPTSSHSPSRSLRASRSS